MVHASRFLPLLLVLAFPALDATAQVADTLLVWRTYAQEAHARVHLYEAPGDARPWTAVVDELASNRAGLATDDARFLAETIGRSFGHDPAEMTFVFRIGAASFCEGASGGRTLLLRATFSRTRAGRLGAPLWRVITRDELAELTDRALF
jgi:hypothetical protein